MSRQISLPPFAAKPRPVTMPVVRSSSGYAVSEKVAAPKQAGPKPRFAAQAETE